MQIELYEDRHREQFSEMFVTYFVDDLSAPFPEETIRTEIVPKFTELSIKKVAPILIATHEGEAVGFVNFQIDSPASNWNERPGWGMLREIYVRRDLRRRGLGTMLATIATRVMAESGATSAYLTADDGFAFWEAMGWTKTPEVAPNGGTVMEIDLKDVEDA